MTGNRHGTAGYGLRYIFLPKFLTILLTKLTKSVTMYK